MQVHAYLCFEGRTEEAIAFYKAKLGATVEMLMRFKDAPDPSMMSPGNKDKVMHASLKIGETSVMASDGRNTGQPDFKGISLSLTAKDEAEAEKLFAALSEGGQVQMPIGQTFFAARFGMVVDKFGVTWMVLAPPK